MSKLFDLFYLCTGVSTDTRTLKKGELFICLSGERFDANLFVQQAKEKGANHIISSDKSQCDGIQIHFVENTLIYLQQLAKYHREKFQIPVIGITGSNGKTTTKELINAVLETEMKVLCTQGNLNNHIGVPLTLLQLNSQHQIAIIEMGANKLGDIDELCEIAEPTHGLITNIGRAHLEGFGSFDGVLQTKLALYRFIDKQKGCIFYNSEDAILIENLPKVETCNYGTNSHSEVQGAIININPTLIFNYTIDSYHSTPLHTQLIGAYNLYNFLAAIAIGYHFGIKFSSIEKGIAQYKPTNNRSQIQKTERNTLIIDCYNANPSSMKAAINSFVQLDSVNKIAVLGDMLELGEVSYEEHNEIIQLCKNNAVELITVGKEFGAINSHCIHFNDTQELIASDILKSYEGHAILIKGSRGIGLEKIIPFL